VTVLIAIERFFALAGSSLAQGRFIRLVLARPQGAEAGLQRVTLRPLELRGHQVLSFLYRYDTRDETKNLPVTEGILRLRELLGPTFRNAHLFTPGEEAQLKLNRKGIGTLTVSASAVERVHAEPVTPATHDRTKQRWIDIDRPFLIELGVTTPQHQLVPAMARKWKQINKFVEVFAHALASSRLADAKQLRVVDFGSGKGYLTFAVHDWLQHTHGITPDVVGVELRPDMVALGNAAISRLDLQGLRMALGDVRQHKPGALNVMIALHACDVATDHAIHLGLRAGADIIMCSPCCHKQIRPQLLSPHPMRAVLQHGVHHEQQAEMVTDSLRALLLESQGYDTQVFEFVSLEHTSKNKMILAVKRPQPASPQAALTQVREIKDFYGIREQCLETLLMQGAAAWVEVAPA
jgi:SAM-dependent methyltransferase